MSTSQGRTWYCTKTYGGEGQTDELKRESMVKWGSSCDEGCMLGSSGVGSVLSTCAKRCRKKDRAGWSFRVL